jgi:HEAT repeat protein
VTALISCLQDESPSIREESAKTLGRIGPPARAAVVELSRLASDRETAVRTSAEAALEKIRATP